MFMESLHQRLDPCAQVRDLVELGVEDMLQYDLYEDKSQNAEMFSILDEEQLITIELGGPIF